MPILVRFATVKLKMINKYQMSWVITEEGWSGFKKKWENQELKLRFKREEAKET